MLLFLAALAVQAPATPPSGWGAPAPASAKVWPTREGDVVLKDFRFRSGETLPELRIHYTTLGQPHRNAAGAIDNAVMVLHGTGGSGQQFLRPQFADELYGPGQPLDIRRYWIILPDNIGHGKSSKPSDGLRMSFPKYDYDDMVEAQHRMLTEALGVTHLRLIFGTSMGCMHAFVWGETWPAFASALMPMACEPIEIAGLNRMWRQLAINGIKADPAWKGGNYRTEPIQGLRTAESLLFVAGSAPLNYQTEYPTNASASVFAEERVRTAMLELDANDLIYQLEFVAELQSVAPAGEHQGPAHVDQFRRRFHQSAQFRLPATGAEAHAQCALPADRGERRHPRPRDPHLGEILEGRP